MLFVQQIRKSGAVPAWCDPVEIEFTKGVEPEELQQRYQLLKLLTDQKIPLHDSLYADHMPYLVSRYRREGAKMSLADLYLGALTRRHQTDLLLLSRNLTDFPTNIFSRDSELLIKKRRTIHVYGLYSYSET